jgi:hypothetical protein
MSLQVPHSLVAGCVQRGQMCWSVVVCGGAMMMAAVRWLMRELLLWLVVR